MAESRNRLLRNIKKEIDGDDELVFDTTELTPIEKLQIVELMYNHLADEYAPWSQTMANFDFNKIKISNRSQAFIESSIKELTKKTKKIRTLKEVLLDCKNQIQTMQTTTDDKAKNCNNGRTMRPKTEPGAIYVLSTKNPKKTAAAPVAEKKTIKKRKLLDRGAFDVVEVEE